MDMAGVVESSRRPESESDEDEPLEYVDVRKQERRGRPVEYFAHLCSECGSPRATYECPRCGVARYCSKECMARGRPKHKAACRTSRKIPQFSSPKETTATCARCVAFDKKMTPPSLASRFCVVGREVLPDDYFDRDRKNRRTVASRGLQRTRWKCACRGCHKQWWCIEEVDPDDVFETAIRWSDTLDAFLISSNEEEVS